MKFSKKIMLFLIATVVTFFGIGYTLLSDTYAVSVLPANLDFEDINFYKCVVDAYNSNNNTNIDYTVSLSDEELATITRLICIDSVDDKITSTKGLEKLTSLEDMYLNVDGKIYSMGDIDEKN